MTPPLLLLPTSMAVPVYVAEDIAVGRCVFQNFVHEEFEVEGVPDEILEEVPDEELEEDIELDHNAVDHHYVDENFAHAMAHVSGNTRLAHQVGVTIREIANQFAKSRERRLIKEEADKVDVAGITYDGFYLICEEVFSRGVTRENIVALFYFCADVVIKCVKSKMRDIGIRIFKWALHYIVDRVCAWVAKHGGWEKAISNTLSPGRIVAIGAAAVGIFAVGGFIIYKWST